MSPEKDREDIDIKERREKEEAREAERRIIKIQSFLDRAKEIKLKQFLEKMEPEDIAEMLGEFSANDKIRLFNFLDPDKAAVVLDDTDSQTRLQILQKVDNYKLAKVLDRGKQGRYP
jgi:Mg/Co/Ni transporter MgtE